MPHRTRARYDYAHNQLALEWSMEGMATIFGDSLQASEYLTVWRLCWRGFP